MLSKYWVFRPYRGRLGWYSIDHAKFWTEKHWRTFHLIIFQFARRLHLLPCELLASQNKQTVSKKKLVKIDLLQCLELRHPQHCVNSLVQDPPA